MRVLSLNCNGLRAATRKGLFDWLAKIDADIIKFQEVRAELAILEKICILQGYYPILNPAEKKGYSGTAILSKQKPNLTNIKTGIDILDKEGRWCEAIIDNCQFVSLYLPSGSSGDEAQARKDIVLEQIQRYLRKIITPDEVKKHIIISGDWNIAHTEKDIKNWRGNRKNSGFLPHERQWLTDLLKKNWVDVYRYLHPNTEGEGYTWWSNRGNAYQNNTGWRIDYQIATPEIAHKASLATVYKEQRFSDHAPLIIDYTPY